ncbi:MAG: hypothetical protein CMN56_09575 [Sneathiella sp.]|uniref:cadmium resistance transporter n=1 Tax=Sneathiella sp. TaxID=1964365 RepID=UPI000C550A3D|nr:cadmium resistance transporter [Sneathiella sp.]MAZ03376.1 hypothetical protein [Sneathiella sp.]
MHDIVIALSVSFMAFISTSMDNLFLLITYTLHPKYGIAKVRAGYLLAVLIMLGISVAVAHGVQFLPAHIVPWIGLIPIAIGLYELWQLRRGRLDAAAEAEDIGSAKRGSVLAITLIMIAHSWDSIAVLAPLLADTRADLDIWMAASVVCAALLLTFFAQKAVGHEKIRTQLTRYAPKILPFLLIAIGLYILTNTPTDIT